MKDPTDVLWDNFKESLTQFQKYLVLGMGASLSFLLLVFSAPLDAEKKNSSSIPGIFVSVENSTAQYLFLAVFAVTGLMAFSVLGRAKHIASKLKNNKELLEAATTFPSIATSKQTFWRCLACASPSLIALMALLYDMSRYPISHPIRDGIGAIVLCLPFIPVACRAYRPVGGFNN